MYRAKAALVAGYLTRSKDLLSARRLLFPELAVPPGVEPHESGPYEGLAPIWDLYANQHQPDYAPFLDTLAILRDEPIRSVLDLACGTGILAARLAASGRQVVGVDASPAMLAKARARCSELPEVQFVEGDFRNVQLGRLFDAIVCAGNSLNYLSDSSELAAVFKVVAEHLRPGGVFVFDAFSELGMTALSGTYLHFKSGDAKFVLHFEFDYLKRRETSTALLPGGVEIHHRVPIDPRDVRRLIGGTKLRIYDYFSSAILPGWMSIGGCFFYILIRQE